jgi:cysteine synthase
MIELPVGYMLLWEEKNPVPDGWISRGTELDFVPDSLTLKMPENVILIEKVDNLTWIEHLAKQRGLVV